MYLYAGRCASHLPWRPGTSGLEPWRWLFRASFGSFSLQPLRGDALRPVHGPFRHVFFTMRNDKLPKQIIQGADCKLTPKPPGTGKSLSFLFSGNKCFS
jgi:hypothetical protein